VAFSALGALWLVICGAIEKHPFTYLFTYLHPCKEHVSGYRERYLLLNILLHKGRYDGDNDVDSYLGDPIRRQKLKTKFMNTFFRTDSIVFWLAFFLNSVFLILQGGPKTGLLLRVDNFVTVVRCVICKKFTNFVYKKKKTWMLLKLNIFSIAYINV